jgi:hypothetical protein
MEEKSEYIWIALIVALHVAFLMWLLSVSPFLFGMLMWGIIAFAVWIITRVESES